MFTPRIGPLISISIVKRRKMNCPTPLGRAFPTPSGMTKTGGSSFMRELMDEPMWKIWLPTFQQPGR